MPHFHPLRPYRLFIHITLAMAAAGCTAGSPWMDAPEGEGLRADVPHEDTCDATLEPKGTACTLDIPLDDPMAPRAASGSTACPRAQSLLESNDAIGDQVLKVRSTSVFQTHAGMIYIGFGERSGACGAGVATARYRAAGPGNYTILSGGGDVFAQPHTAVVERCGMFGSGQLLIESDTGLDVMVTRGAIDVVFPDGTRLLADFAAPLCATE